MSSLSARHTVLSLAAAALVAALALGAPGKSLAGGPAYGTYETDYDGGWYGDGGWYDDVRRDGNVFYNAYNSYDGYARHRYGGYWRRPNDDYGYDGYDGGNGYDNGYGGDYGYGGAYPRRNGKLYYSNYGNYDPSQHAIARTKRRIDCEAGGGRFYGDRCY